MKLKPIIIILFLFINPQTVLASSPYNYANLWYSWNVVAREAYISGVADGIARSFFVTIITVSPEKFAKNPVSPEVKETTDKLFLRYTRDQLRGVMTDLYRDPANSYIDIIDMLLMARDKIEGKDITDNLRESRKQVMKNHELNQRLRSN